LRPRALSFRTCRIGSARWQAKTIWPAARCGVLATIRAAAMTIGSLATPLLVYLIGVRATLVAVGAVTPLTALAARKALRRIDDQSIEVSSNDRTLDVLEAGELFGEMALLRGQQRNATVTALEDVTLHGLGKDEFLAAVSGHPSSNREAEDLGHRSADGTRHSRGPLKPSLGDHSVLVATAARAERRARATTRARQLLAVETATSVPRRSRPRSPVASGRTRRIAGRRRETSPALRANPGLGQANPTKLSPAYPWKPQLSGGQRPRQQLGVLGSVLIRSPKRMRHLASKGMAEVMPAAVAAR
jgi:CRP-like cAMP-binding protein